MDNVSENANIALATSKFVLELIERAKYPEGIEDEVRKAIKEAEDKEEIIFKLWTGAYCLKEMVRQNELAKYGDNPTEKEMITANRDAAKNCELYDAVQQAVLKYRT